MGLGTVPGIQDALINIGSFYYYRGYHPDNSESSHHFEIKKLEKVVGIS